ncbi:PREDICTED: eukaryotic translation initiation factor 2-alpha kinase-like [Dinoponera quadriceps]|uniref:non-specific serine/threonine protein kinase n=1 Tax=Dinoponera quadriceps TaxID=609295 RepID=A0A6P3Y178_DINQU|nr:PREDICTED: eukaryotic translation initiation factor 2-alpha kinase-like [Dinoponera quadriceps]
MPRVTLRILLHHWAIFTIFSCFFVTTDGTAKTNQLTVCVQQSGNVRSLIFVSTLDGKVSALDAANNGKKQWSLDFNDRPMLSSDIHNRELNDNGQWIRLIPSLNGGLYKFDGENLEMLPITTDKLLHSSFRYSNDLIFSGGKESHSYGVHASTGRILYECDVNKCTNYTDGKGYSEQEILVIKRFQHTVRAVEARTGIERWNFSVGHHELMLIPPAGTYCDKANLLDVQIKAVIPEGLILAVNESNPAYKLWQYKFDSPIVSMWRENANKDSTDEDALKEINLFDNFQWVLDQKYSTTSPGLYIGMHQRQLYVQENFKLKKTLDSSRKQLYPTIYPWQPFPAIGTTILNTLSDKSDSHEITAMVEDVQCTTALSVLYNSEYVNGNGFYLYPKYEEESIPTAQYNDSESASITEKPMLVYTEEENTDPTRTIWITFLYTNYQNASRWGGRGLHAFIAISMAMTVITLMHYVPIFSRFNRVVDGAPVPPVATEPLTPVAENKSADDTINDENENINNFISRYLTDFTPVDCLGRGGYGVVFQAKNKLDGCQYAIKRIALPNTEYPRERVMREVRALAKLDHRNIVRYFNSWLEFPPCGWQEDHDKQWAIKLSSSGCPSVISETETKPHDVHIDVPQTDSPSVESAIEAYKLDKNQSEITNDSVVIFEYSNEKQHNDDDAIYIGDSNTDGSDTSSNNATKDLLPNIDGHSESIVFEGSSNSESIVFERSDNNLGKTDSNITEEIDNTEKTDNNNMEEKEGRDRRKALLSLNLVTGSNNCNSRKVFLYIQTELCQRLSLKEWLRLESSNRDSSRVLNIFQQIVDAVEYVHLQGLIHRDLKPSNIFFARDNSIKVGDFGLVTAMTEGYDGTRTPVSENETVTLINSIHTACVGTHLYMSPEQANGQSYNYKVDIYSLGIIYFELLTPFSTDMERAMVLTDLKKSIFPSSFAEKYTAEYNLLKLMLDEDPAKRPTTSGIKAMPPLLNYQAANEINVDKDLKSHFKFPQQTGHSSI